MFRFIVLGKLTAQGKATAGDSLKRAAAASEGAAALGGRLVDIFWTLGQYDFVAIFEMPDAETMTALAMRQGAQGNVETQTMRAFSRDEMQGILSKVSG